MLKLNISALCQDHWSQDDIRDRRTSKSIYWKTNNEGVLNDGWISHPSWSLSHSLLIKFRNRRRSKRLKSLVRIHSKIVQIRSFWPFHKDTWAGKSVILCLCDCLRMCVFCKMVSRWCCFSTQMVYLEDFHGIASEVKPGDETAWNI